MVPGLEVPSYVLWVLRMEHSGSNSTKRKSPTWRHKFAGKADPSWTPVLCTCSEFLLLLFFGWFCVFVFCFFVPLIYLKCGRWGNITSQRSCTVTEYSTTAQHTSPSGQGGGGKYMLLLPLSGMTGPAFDSPFLFFCPVLLLFLSFFFFWGGGGGKIQGDSWKFLDRFKSYFGPQISQSLNKVHIYRLQLKSATKGEFFSYIFVFDCFKSVSQIANGKWSQRNAAR